MPTPPTPRSRIASLAVALLLPVAAAWAGGPPELPSPEARRILLEGHERPALQVPGVPVVSGLQDSYDVVHYDLHVLLDPSRQLVDGTCTIRLRSLVPLLDQVELDLHFPEFVVRRVTRFDRPGAAVEVRRDGDKLRILLLSDPPGPNDEVVLAIDYVGRPRDLPGRSSAVTFEENPVDGTPRLHSFAEPDLARGWWPCKDRPDDKATIDIHLEVPQTLSVAANGVLREARRGRDGYFVWSWTHEHPIATYLVGFSAARFAKWTEPWTWWDETGAERRMTLSYWSWPELAAWAYQDFGSTTAMLTAFSERFGSYPFADEKYALAMFGEDGGMEHQTVTGIGGSVIALSRGTGAVENVLAHELAHQWWGDDVGIDSFESIWLKEGFATWSEALWWEENGGLPSYLEYMDDLSRPLGGGEFAGTVHAPADLFSDTVYFKGAWVLHMLRWVLSGPSLDGNPEPLLDLLRAWRAGRSGGAASTADFVEFISREALRGGPNPDIPLAEWFFPQWLEREERPVYAFDAASHPQAGELGWDTHVRIEQRQAGGPHAMPVHVRLHTEGGGVADRVVFVDSQVLDLSWWTEQRVVSAELDPDGWILKGRVETTEIDRDDDGWPDWLDGCPDVPDPWQLDENANGLPDACEPGLDFDGDGLPNESDCAPADAEAWRLPETDTVLRVRRLDRGSVLLLFEHPATGGQRPYTADVALGSLASLRQDGSMQNAGCLADDHPGDALDSALTFGGLGTYWVATPGNGCGAVEAASTRRNPCP